MGVATAKQFGTAPSELVSLLARRAHASHRERPCPIARLVLAEVRRVDAQLTTAAGARRQRGRDHRQLDIEQLEAEKQLRHAKCHAELAALAIAVERHLNPPQPNPVTSPRPIWSPPER